MLTPKVQKDLKKWLSKQDYGAVTVYLSDELEDIDSNHSLCEMEGHNDFQDIFGDLPLAAQFGIYQDYFWQVHEIWIYVDSLYDQYEGVMYFAFYQESKDIICGSLDEARKTSIQKASELIEKRL